MQSKFRLAHVSHKKKWDELLCCCCDTDLQQTWEYGEAMRKTRAWHLLRHVILFSDQPVGMVQTLVKKLPIPGGVARINRGPLFVRQTQHISPDLPLEIIRFLTHYWSREQGMILYVSPCLLSGAFDPGRLTEIGLKHLPDKRPWASVKLDLCLDKAALKKNMHRTWRRRMKTFRASGLTAEVDNSDEGFSFLMDQYEQFAEERGIVWPTLDQIREMRTASGGGESLQIIFARKGAQRVGGILNIGYGNTCYALITWNSSEGKRLSSPGFLIWESMMLYQKMGYRWYDLGGVDENSYPGITAYKRAMGGVEFALIGSFEGVKQGPYFDLLKKLIDFRRKIKEKWHDSSRQA